MPAGYIERSLGQADFVHRYHGVHLMDFERLLACAAVDPKDPQWSSISDGLVEFGVTSHVTRLWKEPRPAATRSHSGRKASIATVCARKRNATET